MTKSTYGAHAIQCYLEFFNDYLTVAKFAEHKEISIKTAEGLINRGRELYAETTVRGN